MTESGATRLQSLVSAARLHPPGATVHLPEQTSDRPAMGEHRRTHPRIRNGQDNGYPITPREPVEAFACLLFQNVKMLCIFRIKECWPLRQLSQQMNVCDMLEQLTELMLINKADLKNVRVSWQCLTRCLRADALGNRCA